ncbi:hypothetical protein [Salimicrobium humidisoli]|uniref:Uncharacterized protein n=1 Tax=Salimicrobium humidisoli TaxID=2029857 RepID=A0ABX4HQX2_9BACI|nr:hypothetical protein [Salimicrobium humidisoli]PBB04976.1 hypothetical protein CKW00_11190 [Salimicrobium humidisoli]
MNILNEMLKYVGQTVVVVGIVAFLLRTYFKNLITHFFKRELADYQHNLSLITEEQKFDYQRKLQDFNLYRTQRHESYRVLYKNAVTAVKNVKKMGNHQFPNFESMTDDEIFLYLKKEMVDEIDINEALRKYGESEDTSFLKTSLAKAKATVIIKKVEEFENHYRENELYYSKEIIETAKPMIDIFEQLTKILALQSITNSVFDFDINELGISWIEEELSKVEDNKDELEARLESLKSAIVNELSIGEYESISKDITN